MRLSPIAVIFAISSVLFTAGVASATTVTIDGAPVTGAISKDGHILVPFRAPMESIGATVVWSDVGQTGTASYSGHELVRTVIGSPTAYIDGFPKALTVAPVLIEPQHLEYVPVEVIPQISNAVLVIGSDGDSATITNFDLAGVHAAGAGAASQDPQGKILYLWVWLLPISGVLCLLAYIFATGEVMRRHRRSPSST
jgi:hypothetical protein